MKDFSEYISGVINRYPSYTEYLANLFDKYFEMISFDDIISFNNGIKNETIEELLNEVYKYTVVFLQIDTVSEFNFNYSYHSSSEEATYFDIGDIININCRNSLHNYNPRKGFFHLNNTLLSDYPDDITKKEALLSNMIDSVIHEIMHAFQKYLFVNFFNDHVAALIKDINIVLSAFDNDKEYPELGNSEFSDYRDALEDCYCAYYDYEPNERNAFIFTSIIMCHMLDKSELNIPNCVKDRYKEIPYSYKTGYIDEKTAELLPSPRGGNTCPCEIFFTVIKDKLIPGSEAYNTANRILNLVFDIKSGINTDFNPMEKFIFGLPVDNVNSALLDIIFCIDTPFNTLSPLCNN